MKHMRFVMILLLLFLTACTVDDPMIDDIECNDDQVLEDGSCVPKDDPIIVVQCEDDQTLEDGECVDIEPVDESCTATQIEVDDECITLSGPQMQLYQVLGHMESKHNYQINVTITEPDTTVHTIVLAYDGTTSSFTDDQERIFYTTDGTTCTMTTDKFNAITTSSYDCEDSPLFYSLFTYEMFELVGGQYTLSNTSFPVIEDALATALPNATLASLTMQISTETISQIQLILLFNEEQYTMRYNFTNYDGVSITIPSE